MTESSWPWKLPPAKAGTTHLKVGDRAPDFTLTDQNGKKVKLSDFQGKKNVVIPGYLNQRENVRAFLGDPDGYFLMGLEKWDQATGVASKTAIFSERVMPREGERAVSAETAEQALLISLSAQSSARVLVFSPVLRHESREPSRARKRA